MSAMLSILVRYGWKQFSVVTSEIAGHDDFVQAVRDRVADMRNREQFRCDGRERSSGGSEPSIIVHSMRFLCTKI